jgi:hypothetical protein
MRLITLLAGYAAGLAVAMKYRKDNGISRITDAVTGKSKLDTFIDEIVDIHKSVFADVRGLVGETFDDVENWDDLQSKVSGVVAGFSSNLETHIATAKQAGTTKKAELLKLASDFYATHEATLESAKSRAASFSGIPEATIDSWIATARQELQSAYTAIESRFATTPVPAIKKTPVRKSTTTSTPKN